MPVSRRADRCGLPRSSPLLPVFCRHRSSCAQDRGQLAALRAEVKDRKDWRGKGRGQARGELAQRRHHPAEAPMTITDRCVTLSLSGDVLEQAHNAAAGRGTRGSILQAE